MKVGLQISSFSWPGGADAIGPTLARVAHQADDIGFDSIWVMDHFFQIRGVGPARGADARGHDDARLPRGEHSERPARADGRRRPLPPSGPVGEGDDDARRPVRRPGLARDRRGLEQGRVATPSASRSRRSATGSRCSRRRSGSPTGCGPGERGSEEAFRGRHYTATRLLNSPQSISRPRPPIMIGGGGERKTLRLVAQYADACNVFGGPIAIHHKYEVLREHCAAIGRDPDEIERSTLQSVSLGTETPAQVVDRFGELSDAGAQHVIFSVERRRRSGGAGDDRPGRDPATPRLLILPGGIDCVLRLVR